MSEQDTVVDQPDPPPDDEYHRQVAAEVAAMRREGSSTRRIAEQLGLSQSNVVRVLRGLVERGELDEPERVLGRDGRERPARRGTPVDQEATEDTGPVDTMTVLVAAEVPDFYAGARAAIPGIEHADRAESACTARMLELGVPLPLDRHAPVLELTGRLLDGEPLAELGTLGAELLATEQAHAARAQEFETVSAARTELRAQREQQLRDGVDAGFEWLHECLQVLLADAAPDVAALGPVRSAEDVMGAQDPTAARDALTRVRGHGALYGALREAQCRLLVAAQLPGSRQPWRDVVEQVRCHGSVDPGAGTPPADPTAAVVWFCTDESREAQVPALGVLLDRAYPEVEPTGPPVPTTDLFHRDWASGESFGFPADDREAS